MAYLFKKTILFPLFLSALFFFSALDVAGFVFVPVDPLPIVDSTIVSEQEDFFLNGLDGPYLFKKKKKIREIRVVKKEEQYEIEEFTHCSKEQIKFTCSVDNKERDSFSFQLMDKIIRPKTVYKQPAKLLAISDIEGNFNALYSLLIGNKVMNESYEWTYGEGHLVFVGDIVDRGKNVTQCLWLIYKLEQEAKKQGGMVHFILGNHEMLNFNGTTEYVANKYVALAQKISGKEDTEKAYKYLMSNQRELVKWMKSKNVVERIGKTIFVHGGLSTKLIDTNMSLKEINAFLRTNGQKAAFLGERDTNMLAFLHGPLGPLWYRGIVCRYKKIYQKATKKEVQRTLSYFQAEQMVIGHTVVLEVSSDYDGSVYRTDIGFPHDKFTGKAQGLLIEEQQFYRVNDLGAQVLLN